MIDVGFADAAYYAFIPKLPGRIVVVRNDGKYIRLDKRQIALNGAFVNLLTGSSGDGKCSLTVLE